MTSHKCMFFTQFAMNGAVNCKISTHTLFVFIDITKECFVKKQYNIK